MKSQTLRPDVHFNSEAYDHMKPFFSITLPCDTDVINVLADSLGYEPKTTICEETTLFAKCYIVALCSFLSALLLDSTLWRIFASVCKFFWGTESNHL